MQYLSVCSGIEAASVAWDPLGWCASALAEIEPFPAHVLTHRQRASRPMFMPDPAGTADAKEEHARRAAIKAVHGLPDPSPGLVPNFGDLTRFKEWPDAIVDLLVGGTPCQSFSVAGLRKGLDDPRGNLALTYLAVADRYRPKWVVWENVPGVLSSNKGRDFGAFLGGLGQLGYGWAYRVLDAQFVRTRGLPRAVPQRRRRVFVVGYLGNWRAAAAVLFDRQSMRGDPPPRREARQGAAGSLSARSRCGGGLGIDFEVDGGLIPEISNAIAARDAKQPRAEDNVGIIPVAHSLRAEGFDASEDGTGRGTPLVPMAFDCKGTEVQYTTDGSHPTLRSMGHDHSHQNAGGHAAVAFNWQSGGDCRGLDPQPVTMALQREQTPAVMAMNLRGREGGAMPELDALASLRAAEGGSSRSYVELAGTAETMYGVSHADAAQTGPDQALRALREAVGEKAFAEWGAGIAAALRASEVLRSEVHGRGFRCSADDGNGVDDHALSRPEAGRAWTVQQVWEAGCVGRPPQGREPSEQLARELGAHLSLLPHSRASAARFLLCLWRASEGLGLLREALSAVQEIWRPAADQGQPAHSGYQVRRLTPLEAERLQGFPDGWTDIPWRGGNAPDGRRYKALGNSMAVNVMEWIGARIAFVEDILAGCKEAGNV